MLDAIVIGTGPAGGLAALRLAEAGARVLVLEKSRLPREKACGGALTASPVRAVMDWDFSGVVESEIRLSRMRFGESHRDLQHRSAALLVNRRDFDLHIVERAVERGRGSVELRDGFAISRVEEDEEGVTAIGRNGERCRARYLVGADGAAGRTGASLGLARRTRAGVALDAEIEVDAATWDEEKARMTFDFAPIRGGYAWIFPKNGYLSCGVGAWTGAVPLPGALDSYLAGALRKGAIVSQKRRGHPIPLYEGPAPISTRRVCLAGDSASLVDPILGEGIRFALASGTLAASVIVEQLGGAHHAEDGLEYSRRVHAAMGEKLDRVRRFILPIFLKNPAAFYRTFYEAGHSYSALARSLAEKFAAGAASPLAIERSAQS